MDQNLIFIMVGYIGTIISVIVFVTRTIGSLANKQQDEGERKDLRIEALVTRLSALETKLGFEEGVSKTLKEMLETERQFQRERDSQWQDERTALRERLTDLERQLSELKQHNESKAGEITTLQEQNAALVEHRDSLQRTNASLEDALTNMTERLDKQDTERKRLIKERETLDKLRIELTRKLEECEEQEQEQTHTEPSDDNQSQEDLAA